MSKRILTNGRSARRFRRPRDRESCPAFVDDLRAGTGFRKSLRVKKMLGHEDIWEMTWAADGRVTFHYGAPRVEGEPHIVWRRIGTHQIFARP